MNIHSRILLMLMDCYIPLVYFISFLSLKLKKKCLKLCFFLRKNRYHPLWRRSVHSDDSEQQHPRSRLRWPACEWIVEFMIHRPVYESRFSEDCVSWGEVWVSDAKAAARGQQMSTRLLLTRPSLAQGRDRPRALPACTFHLTKPPNTYGTLRIISLVT